MATKPGILTEWPWQKLGSFKYVVLAPWLARSAYLVAKACGGDDGRDGCLTRLDIANLFVVPFMLARMIHNQLWISMARFMTARSRHRIVDKGIEFEQVDRERNWDDQIILNGLIFYTVNMLLDKAKFIPIYRTDGLILTFILHAGPVEFLYYWLHRALHHHFLYSRYHSHHHASIVTEPITSVIHPFAEHVSYFFLFSIPTMTTVFTRTVSISGLFIYISYIDFMNNMGHCNFELVPRWIFKAFPPLKYIMYTPSFHSLHHTQFRTNYSLFMPFYDYIYGTMDKSSDILYESASDGRDEGLDVVHITHPTTLMSIYHLRLGFASIASKPYVSRWYLAVVTWPLTWASVALTWMVGSTVTVERNSLGKLCMQTWAIPRYSFQFSLKWERESINKLIDGAIVEAEEKGAKVVSLGLLSQDEELNRSGELFLQRHPKLRVKIADGSGLAAAVVLHSIPKGTKQVLIRGKPAKVASALALSLLKKGIKVVMVSKTEYHTVKSSVPVDLEANLILSNSYGTMVWLLGDGTTDEEQRRAAKGTYFIPFSQFPPRKTRKDCKYHNTPALRIPKDLENMHSCENWLPRRVMSAWRISGIVHALEGWDIHECGTTMVDVDKALSAAIRHGFLPL